MRDVHLGRTLLATARMAIASELGRAVGAWPEHAALASFGATFVTLMKSDGLRGCIGTLQARRALRDDVRINAVAAAFGDPRFPPLQDDEFDDTSVEVSLLSPPERVESEEETGVLVRLRPDVDGVILEYGTQRATFLPQVWESLPSPREFLIELKRKAGLPADFWPADTRLGRCKMQRYRVVKWQEATAP
ncbi:MAG: AmmeMemoRadiSam system protein A [Betaproteobacteria bacterium]|nr:MAG: AmmeMemoRadiSam system protein A [Betaproteobacteria bacterium]